MPSPLVSPFSGTNPGIRGLVPRLTETPVVPRSPPHHAGDGRARRAPRQGRRRLRHRLETALPRPHGPAGLVEGRHAPPRRCWPSRPAGGDRLADVTGPVIFTPNHHSHLDTPLMLTSIPEPWRHKLFVGAGADYFFTNRATSALSPFHHRGHPRRAQEVTRRSADQAARLIDEGWACSSSRGRRSPDGWGQPFRGGAACRCAAASGGAGAPAGHRPDPAQGRQAPHPVVHHGHLRRPAAPGGGRGTPAASPPASRTPWRWPTRPRRTGTRPVRPPAGQPHPRRPRGRQVAPGLGRGPDPQDAGASSAGPSDRPALTLTVAVQARRVGNVTASRSAGCVVAMAVSSSVGPRSAAAPRPTGGEPPTTPRRPMSVDYARIHLSLRFDRPGAPRAARHPGRARPERGVDGRPPRSR